MQINKVSYLGEWFFELGKGIVVFLVIVILIHFFIATVFVVDGASMVPNFLDGEYILVDKISYLIGAPQRGDSVILKFPGDPEHKKYIKRVIGLPGETLEIKKGEVFINNKKLDEFYLPTNILTYPDSKTNLGTNEYYMIGDNRVNSSDSRIWGICPKKYIIGRALMVLYPFSQFSVIPQVDYYN